MSVENLISQAEIDAPSRSDPLHWRKSENNELAIANVALSLLISQRHMYRTFSQIHDEDDTEIIYNLRKKISPQRIEQQIHKGISKNTVFIASEAKQ